MKKIIISLLFLIWITDASSQTISPKVLASAGGYSTGGGISVSWTMGEPFQKTLLGDNKILTQGFQQPYFPNKTLNLKMFIEGFYSGDGLMQYSGAGCLNVIPISDPMYSSDPEDVDDITITAMDANTYLPVESKVGRLKTNGEVSVTFSAAATAGNDYYLQLTHRNLVETWSKNPISLFPVTNYDFTTASTQAYDDGFNPPMKVVSTVPIRWAVYNGDINQDGAVDALDMTLEEDASNAGLFGYYDTDLTGDGASDSLDMTVIEDNGNAGVFEAHP